MKKFLVIILFLIASTVSADPISIGGNRIALSGGNPIELAAGGGGETTYTLVDTLGATNGDIGLVGSPVASAYLASEAFDLTRIDIEIVCNGGGCTGDIYAAVYESSTSGADDVPDDRVQLASGTLDASTLINQTNTFDGACYETIDFGTSISLNTSDYVQIVIWTDGSGNIEIGRRSFGGIGYFTRTGSPPGETNDAANWAEFDTNGGISIRTYKSP